VCGNLAQRVPRGSPWSNLTRRQLATLLGSAAAWPLAAHAQHGGQVRRVGVMNGNEKDPVYRAYVAAFVQTLQRLGWREGQNLRIGVPYLRPRADKEKPFLVVLKRSTQAKQYLSESGERRPRPDSLRQELPADARAIVSDAIDGAVVVVRDQHRAVLEDEHVRRPSNIIVVLDKAGDERLHGFHRAVLVERHNGDVELDVQRRAKEKAPDRDDRG
jgi:hypothetical protein